jgi:hypothetical protein
MKRTSLPLLGRREFITLIGAAVVAWPLVAQAQQATMPAVGFLSLSPESTLHQTPAVQRARRDAGYEGDNVASEYRRALERLPEMEAEPARRPVDILKIAAPTNPRLPVIAETSPQNQVITTTATASTESSACSASQGRAYNLCMVRGFFNITGVSCTCTQTGSANVPLWECVSTATCKK